jgi:hypothetical protein
MVRQLLCGEYDGVCCVVMDFAEKSGIGVAAKKKKKQCARRQRASQCLNNATQN